MWPRRVVIPNGRARRHLVEANSSAELGGNYEESPRQDHPRTGKPSPLERGGLPSFGPLHRRSHTKNA